MLAAAGATAQVHIWDLPAYFGRHQLSHEGTVNALAFTADATILASGGMDKYVRIWDTSSGNQMHALLHDEYILALAFAPAMRQNDNLGVVNPPILAAGGGDKRISIWNTSSGAPMRAPAPGPSAVRPSTRQRLPTACADTHAAPTRRRADAPDGAPPLHRRAQVDAAARRHHLRNDLLTEWRPACDGGRRQADLALEPTRPATLREHAARRRHQGARLLEQRDRARLRHGEGGAPLDRLDRPGDGRGAPQAAYERGDV